MSATTEICSLALVAGSDIGDPNSAAARVVKECCDTIMGQEGMKKLWYGTEDESPGTLQLFLDWETKADHEKFIAANAYKSFRETLDTIHTGIPDVVHVDFQPDGGVSAALSAPVTEVATFYYDEAPPETAFDGAKTLIEALRKEGQKILGWAFGTTHEVIEREGVKGKGNVLVVGWETVQAHFDSHNTQALKDNIHRLTTPEVKAIEMHHVQATAHHSN